MSGKLSSLRLHDVLVFLRTPEGEKILEPIKRDTYALANMRELDPVEFYRGAPDPGAENSKQDPFRVDLLEKVFDQNDNRSISRVFPGAVADALAKVADDSGQLNLEQVRSVLGAYAAGLTETIAAQISHFHTPELPYNTKYSDMSASSAQKIARAFQSDWGRARMPLLGIVSRMFGGPEAFKGFKMASLSHLFATRPALYEEMEKNGLARQDHLISGKGYSRNIDVVYSLKADGWTVDDSLVAAENNYKKGEHDDLRAISVLRQLFDGVDPKGDQKFLLLDDGGNLAVALHKHFPEYAHLCRVVEQTDHGIQRIEREILATGQPLLCPVINMARSALKKLFESPMIGEAVVHSTETLLKDIHPSLGFGKKEVAMLGFGAVNEATARALLRRKVDPKSIWVYDIDPAKMEWAKSLGFSIGTREQVLAHGELLFSATGQTTITPDEYGLLPADAILVNGGSGNHELGMDTLDVKDKEVASISDGRRYTRVGARADQRDEVQVVQFLKVALDHLRNLEWFDKEPIPKTASIIGYDDDAKKGIRHLIAQGFLKKDIVVCDPNPAQRKAAIADGFKIVDRDTAIRGSTLVVTTTKNAVTGDAEHRKLSRGAIQVVHGPAPKGRGDAEDEQAREGHVSPQQRDQTLGRDEEYYRGFLVNNGVKRTGEGYRHRVLHTGRGTDVLVLRSGYVVNMETGIPPEYAQLILSMLLSSLLQATKTTDPGLITMDNQPFLQAQMQKLLRKLGRKLDPPSFVGLKPAI
ncbi:MAG: hypothetical protein U1E65_18035 [Myxococcota bacterium]